MYDAARERPSDINQLLPVLFRYAGLCNHVTEFGIRSGNSTAALLAGTPEVYCGYDLHTHEAHDRLLEAARRIGVDALITYADTATLEDIEETDLLFVDTCHTRTQVEAELRHLRRVRKFVLFHDTVTFGERGELPDSEGICPAIRAILGPSPDWTLVENHTESNGLQVWERK